MTVKFEQKLVNTDCSNIEIHKMQLKDNICPYQCRLKM